ncbi:hypothetical protein [Falsibacillus pallidus]|uniref:Uncharacterized protein n=1 Tax=Falsibacillus pallidus TaxID=493781 RepID=A0A370GCG5_9BACI|nr:hypothetical protein [Falsibacillus pallidus]RDI41401.1 hypothetical protein DFR59_10851 [Falsibacillus pallidus]
MTEYRQIMGKIVKCELKLGKIAGKPNVIAASRMIYAPKMAAYAPQIISYAREHGVFAPKRGVHARNPPVYAPAPPVPHERGILSSMHRNAPLMRHWAVAPIRLVEHFYHALVLCYNSCKMENTG